MQRSTEEAQGSSASPESAPAGLTEDTETFSQVLAEAAERIRTKAAAGEYSAEKSPAPAVSPKKKRTYEELVAALEDTKKPKFVCYACDEIVFGEPSWLATSKWGYERPFCDDCGEFCKKCGEYYAPSMDYYHEGCGDDSDSEDEKPASGGDGPKEGGDVNE